MLHHKLKYLMLQAGMSPKELSAATNIDKSTIIKILSGITTNPRVETVYTLAKYFKIEISELIEDTYSNEFIIKPNHSDLHSILKYLMTINGVSSLSLLNKYTGISLSILSDLLNGKTKQPHMKTLQQLATFFNITVTQLSGLEQIPSHKTATITPERKSVPVITLEQTEQWISGNLTQALSYSSTSRSVIGNKAYAINIVDNTLQPDFIRNQVLIIDNEEHVSKHDFVVCKVKNKISIFECMDLSKTTITLRESGQINFNAMHIDEAGIMGVIVQLVNK